MNLDCSIDLYCTFGGGMGSGNTASSTAPIGQHPEPDGTVGRFKMQKGGRDKGGVQAEGPKVVCFDFDGVLSKYDGWKGADSTGSAISKAVSLVKKLHSDGFKIVVLTARSKLSTVQKWLDAHGLSFAKATNTKPPAAAYIDDRAVRWPASEKEIRSKLEAQKISDPDTREFIQKTKPQLFGGGPGSGRHRTFEVGNDAGMRQMQFRFHRNGNIKVRVVGKGNPWVQSGVLEPKDSPEKYLRAKFGNKFREIVDASKNGLKGQAKAALRATSGGQSEGSSRIARKFYVVDGQGRILHTYRTREEAEQASAGNRYTKVVTHVEQATPLEDTPEVRDMIRKRPGDTQVRTFRRSLPFPNTPYPGSPQGR